MAGIVEATGETDRGKGARGIGLLLAVALCLLPPVARAQDPSTVAIRWLGTNAISIASGQTTILIDPYLSRPGRMALVFGWYRPDSETLARYIDPAGPSPEFRWARIILVGHSHFDHLGDVPWFADNIGAVVVGTETTANISRGYGVPAEKTTVAVDGDVLEVGPFTVRVIASRHGKVLFGRVPFDGVVTEPPEAPIHAMSFKMGGALAYHVTHRPSSKGFYFLSSADLDPDALERFHRKGLRTDVVFATLPGRDERYFPLIVEKLRPAEIIPVHYDDFTVPLEEAQGAWLGEARLDDLDEEVNQAAKAAGVKVSVKRIEIGEQITFAAEK